ncbi:MAG: cardiolipin synthase B, partial [Gemmatimonadales bacterium]
MGYTGQIPAIERAFTRVASTCGTPLAAERFAAIEAREHAGEARVHVIANEPDEAGTFRMDLVVASIARRELWLTDAY